MTDVNNSKIGFLRALAFGAYVKIGLPETSFLFSTFILRSTFFL